jgi:hypothetical protein
MQQFNFLILDAAIAEGNINSAIALNKNYKSLIKSKSEDELESVAPYFDEQINNRLFKLFFWSWLE